jgi:hypothetical protein
MRCSVTKKKHNSPAVKDQDVFPILFSIEDDMSTVNRLADFWEATGLQAEIQTIGASYVLILHEPEAGL